jgi:anti-sigma regulatory factor (Ser/Thr protein kinase)
MCTAINGIVTDEQVRMDSAETKPESRTPGTKDTQTVTSAQARDLTHGRHELRTPIRTQGAPSHGFAIQDVPQDAGPHQQAREPAPAQGVPEHGVPEPAGRVPGGQSQLFLVADPESVKAARDFTAATLRGWQLEALVDEGVIIASELVTNAIRHGGCLAASGDDGKVELAWRRDASRVLCVVTDGSSVAPVLAVADMSAESGRGLHVVHALAASWGWTMLSSQEKAVWAALLMP